MACARITVNEIRRFILDRARDNTLIADVKWLDEDIDAAMIDVIDMYNIIPPPIVNIQSIESFPSRYLLKIGVAGHLLRGAAVGDAINQLNYAAENVSVQDRNQAGLFTELGNSFIKDFEDKARQMKITQNVNNLLGSVNSEYSMSPMY